MISVVKQKKYWYEQICANRNDNTYYRVDGSDKKHTRYDGLVNWGYVIAPHELGYWND